MFVGVMLLGVLAAFAMPAFGDEVDDSFGQDEDEDSIGRQDAVLDDGIDTGGMVDQGAQGGAGEDYVAGGVSGVRVIDGFVPGEDSLTLQVPSDAAEFEIADAGDDTLASLSYTSSDDVTEVQFTALDSVPMEDIAVLLDGEGDPIPLAEYLGEPDEEIEDEDAGAEHGGDGDDIAVLPPDDPEVPSTPGDPDQPDDDVRPPDDPELPSDPSDPDQSDDDVLPPDDPELPAVPGAETVQPEIVTDFTAGKDVLYIELEDSSDGERPGLLLVRDDEDTLVFVDGQAVAVLQGAGDVTPDDIRLGFANNQAG